MIEKIRLKDFQNHALQVLKRKKIDLVCIAPTGSGKGVIVEELAKNPHERILLLSPLIALGRQQWHRFTAKGIPAYCSMGQDNEQKKITLTPETRIWILSPESALAQTTEKKVREWKPTLIVIDECHCVFEWGADFRPAYGLLPRWVAGLEVSRTLWMSATLPKVAIAVIESELHRKLLIQGSFALPETLDVRFLRTPWSNRVRILSRMLREKSDGGIVFTGSRQMTERIQKLIHASGRESFFYHAGLAHEERRIIENKVQNTPHSVVVATSAFGMGMDYPHLTWTVLWQPPRTVLSLAQALGRVGRNQRHGQALLLWDEVDLRFLNEEMRSLLKKDASGHPRKHLEKYFH